MERMLSSKLSSGVSVRLVGILLLAPGASWAASSSILREAINYYKKEVGNIQKFDLVQISFEGGIRPEQFLCSRINLQPVQLGSSNRSQFEMTWHIEKSMPQELLKNAELFQKALFTLGRLKIFIFLSSSVVHPLLLCSTLSAADDTSC